MVYQLTEIKKLRLKLGLNQKELADKSGVSQSLIAKIEAGKIEPTYTKANNILETLRQLEEKEETKARDLMNKKLVFAPPEEKIKDIIKIMKQKGIYDNYSMLNYMKLNSSIIKGNVEQDIIALIKKEKAFNFQ